MLTSSGSQVVAMCLHAGHAVIVTRPVLYVQIAWTYLLSRAASDAQPLDSEEDDRLVEAHPS